MARTLSEALTTAQQSVSATPYIRIYVNATDYWSRLLYLEHIEEAYRDSATIILRNDDRALDIGTLDLTGKELDISYGHITGNAVAEPNGNNDTAEYSKAANLWVKSQQNVSIEGRLTCQLQCEGMWDYLREKRLMAVGNPPYYDYEWTTLTPYQLMEQVIETAMSWTLSDFSGTQDGIINTFIPTFAVNNMPYENAATVLYRLIWMTKCFLRAKTGKTFELVYPQSGDSVTQIYFSDQAHFFKDFRERNNLLIPNSIAVYANRDDDGGWGNVITGTASNAGEIAKYTEILEPSTAETIDNQTDADGRAAAILARGQAERGSGVVLVPHDASVELYDRVSVHDNRAGAVVYPYNSLVRAGNLIHRYSPGIYTLEIVLGDVRSRPELPDPRLEMLAKIPRAAPTVIRTERIIERIYERTGVQVPRPISGYYYGDIPYGGELPFEREQALPSYFYQQLPIGAPELYPITGAVPRLTMGAQPDSWQEQMMRGYEQGVVPQIAWERPTTFLGGLLYDVYHGLYRAPEPYQAIPGMPGYVYGLGEAEIGQLATQAVARVEAAQVVAREYTEAELGTPGF